MDGFLQNDKFRSIFVTFRNLINKMEIRFLFRERDGQFYRICFYYRNFFIVTITSDE